MSAITITSTNQREEYEFWLRLAGILHLGDIYLRESAMMQ